MTLSIENAKWEICIEDSLVLEYDNYISGFSPITEGDFTFDTVRVFISLNRKTNAKEVYLFPWKSGETYPQDEHLLPLPLKQEMETLIKVTPFYNELSVETALY